MRSLLVALTGLAVLSMTGYADTIDEKLKAKIELASELKTEKEASSLTPGPSLEAIDDRLQQIQEDQTEWNHLQEKVVSLRERLRWSLAEIRALRERETEALRRAEEAKQRVRKADEQRERYEEILYDKISALRGAHHGCEVIYNTHLPSNFGYRNDASDVFTKAEMDENEYSYQYYEGKFEAIDPLEGISCKLLASWQHDPEDGFTIYGFTMRRKRFKDGSLEVSARSAKFDDGRTTLKLGVATDGIMSLDVETHGSTARSFAFNNKVDVNINAEGEVLHINYKGSNISIRVGSNLLNPDEVYGWDKSFILEAMMREMKEFRGL